MAERIYKGWRDARGNASAAKFDGDDQFRLDPRLDLRCHSPTGFEWGYGGSGPAQLALAILADALGNDARALRLYQNFKTAAIQSIDRDTSWTMSRAVVIRSAEKIEEAMRRADPA
jgi:hypothetical protein